MEPIWKVRKFDAKNEYQNRGPQHSHFYVHVCGASQTDVDPDITVKKLIEKYVTCSLPCKKRTLNFMNRLKPCIHTIILSHAEKERL